MVRTSDLLMCAAGSLGKVYLHGGDDPACYAGYLVRFRPRLDLVEPRFIAYWAESQPFLDQIAVGAVRSTIENFSAGKFKQMELRIPDLEAQCRIANYLDIEVGRIDALHQRVLGAASLVEERANAVVDLAVASSVHPIKKLKNLAQVTVGIVVTPTAWYVEADGVAALRGVNVQPGRLVEEDIVQISHAGHSFHVKSRLRAGDVVVVRTGQAGAAAVVPPQYDGANCIDLLLVRPGENLQPRYLEYFLNSSQAKRAVALESVGSIQAHYNVSSIKGLEIPLPPPDVQEAIVRTLDQQLNLHARLRQRLKQEECLLEERRLSLITAAVTGNLKLGTTGCVA